MNCPACGTALSPDVRFCPRCGNAVAATPINQQYTYPAQQYGLPYNRVARSVQILAILWLVYTVIRLLTGIAAMLFLHGIVAHHWAAGDFGPNFSFSQMGLSGLWPVALASLLVSVGCALLTGLALLSRQPWARVVAIIFGVLALIHFPFGTALGIYTLWVMAPTASGNEYAALTARRAA